MKIEKYLTPDVRLIRLKTETRFLQTSFEFGGGSGSGDSTDTDNVDGDYNNRRP